MSTKRKTATENVKETAKTKFAKTSSSASHTSTAAVDTMIEEATVRAQEKISFAEQQKWSQQLNRKAFETMVVEARPSKGSNNIDFLFEIHSDAKSKFPPSIRLENMQVKFQSLAGLGSSSEKKTLPADFSHSLIVGCGAPAQVLEKEASVLASDACKRGEIKYSPILETQRKIVKALEERVEMWREWAWKNPNVKPLAKAGWKNSARETIANIKGIAPEKVSDKEVDDLAKKSFDKVFKHPIKYPDADSKYADQGPTITFKRKVWTKPYTDEKGGVAKKKNPHRVGSFTKPEDTKIYEQLIADGYVYNAPLIHKPDGKVKPYPPSMDESLIKNGDLITFNFTEKFTDLKGDNKEAHLKFVFHDIMLLFKGPDREHEMPASDFMFAQNSDEEDEGSHQSHSSASVPPPVVLTNQVTPQTDETVDE